MRGKYWSVAMDNSKMCKLRSTYVLILKGVLEVPISQIIV